MPDNLPYVTSPGTLTKMLGKLKTAAEPEMFSTEFVEKTLSMKGGTARSVMPFLKKMGFVAQDGRPTARYKQFRNKGKSGAAIAEAMRVLYKRLFEMNEQVHELSDDEVKNLVVEATGGEVGSQVTKLTMATYKLLNGMAVYNEESQAAPVEQNVIVKKEEPEVPPRRELNEVKSGEIVNLSYTVNLNLPPTSDIEVFNAIFKSLKEHLLDRS